MQESVNDILGDLDPVVHVHIEDMVHTSGVILLGFIDLFKEFIISSSSRLVVL